MKKVKDIYLHSSRHLAMKDKNYIRILQIPAPAIHRDPQYYPDPHNFNPEANFSREARAARPPYAVSFYIQKEIRSAGSHIFHAETTQNYFNFTYEIFVLYKKCFHFRSVFVSNSF